MIAERELPDIKFSERDAILLTDGHHFAQVKLKAGPTFANCLVFPLSTLVYDVIFQIGHDHIGPTADYIEMAEIKSANGIAEGLSGTWLRELGLSFIVEGIDIARLDATSQYLLIVKALYLTGLARRIVEANRQIDTFYIVTGSPQLPQDFYFDSDVAAAILRFTCEALGRNVRTIVMGQRLYVLPWMQWRPHTDAPAPPPSERSQSTVPPPAGRRVGFAPATIANCEEILDSLDNLGCQVIQFPSTWQPNVMPGCGRLGSDHHVYRLSAAAGNWSVALASQLTDLWAELVVRRERSSLPDAVIRNPHLDFQLEYLITRRWLSYANMIKQAAAFVAQMPLDLLIVADHFTAEAAILAQFYRRAGVPVLIAQHSGWPVDNFWSHRAPTDAALAWTRSGETRLRRLSAITDIVTIGKHTRQTYHSLLDASSAAEELRVRRRAAGNRKIVLFIANALTLDTVPYVHPKRHIETVAALAKIPDFLENRVMVAVRTKPGSVHEQASFYQALCGFPPSALKFLDGLSFSAALELADCVIGVNVPTTGYFEIISRGIPLIHVQSAESLTMEPDLPFDVLGCVTEPEGIWPALEAVLFDDDRRRDLLERQRRFLAEDCAPSTGEAADPIEAALRRLLPGTVEAAATATPPIVRLPLSLQGGRGAVEDVLQGSQGTLMIDGWAADTARHRPAKSIHVFIDGRPIGTFSIDRPRRDVAEALGDDGVEKCGFFARLPAPDRFRLETLSVCAEMADGNFVMLPVPTAS